MFYPFLVQATYTAGYLYKGRDMKPAYALAALYTFKDKHIITSDCWLKVSM